MDDRKDLSNYDQFLVNINYQNGKPNVKYKLMN